MLSHEIHGSGEPLVLVHGLTHRRQAWHPVLELPMADDPALIARILLDGSRAVPQEQVS